MQKLELRLYIVSGAPNSISARTNLASILEDLGDDAWSLEIVDCAAEPKRALADGVLVTPTLLKLGPPPKQTIIGSLADRVRVIGALGIERIPARNGRHE